MLVRYAVNQVGGLEHLVRVATFTALIGNADAHGKNLAFLHSADGDIRLAPLYDTVPTILFPRLKNEAAMTIGGLTNLANVDLAAITREARRWHLDPVRASSSALGVAEQLLAALDTGAIDPESQSQHWRVTDAIDFSAQPSDADHNAPRKRRFVCWSRPEVRGRGWWRG